MAGRSSGRSRRLIPGLSSRQLPKAASLCRRTWPKARAPAARLRPQAAVATIHGEYPLLGNMTAPFTGAHYCKESARLREEKAPGLPPIPHRRCLETRTPDCLRTRLFIEERLGRSRVGIPPCRPAWLRRAGCRFHVARRRGSEGTASARRPAAASVRAQIHHVGVGSQPRVVGEVPAIVVRVLVEDDLVAVP